ncbi:MAG: hypothetical protein IKI88_02950, partial [Anaerotignum sp.]|nr:hypothetical protein [Anaerotignum sp.]
RSEFSCQYPLASSGFLKPAKFVLAFVSVCLKLTMGCVFISIVQFSRINSACSAAKISLSNLLSFVKHFFDFFQSFCALLIFHQQK